MYMYFVVIQSLSHVQLFATPWTAAQAFLSFRVSWSLLKLVSVESIMPTKKKSLLFLLSVFPTSGAFPVSWLFTSCGQSIEVSASVLVHPMSIQG